MKNLLMLPLILVWSLSCLAAEASAQTPNTGNETPGYKDDIVARVGDQPITFNQLSTMLNSSAIVGLSIPALGTPERDQVRLTLLDKVISANLLYLDAVKQGLDKDPGLPARSAALFQQHAGACVSPEIPAWRQRCDRGGGPRVL